MQFMLKGCLFPPNMTMFLDRQLRTVNEYRLTSLSVDRYNITGNTSDSLSLKAPPFKSIPFNFKEIVLIPYEVNFENFHPFLTHFSPVLHFT